jgi:PAS domain S-box-containing protein
MAVSHYGYTKEEFLSMTAYDLLPEEDRQILRDRIKNTTGKQFFALDRHVKKNGEIIDVEIRGHVINYRGKKAGLVTGVDVTEELKTEEKLKQKEEFYRSITENSSDIQLVTDKEGKITFASRPIFKKFGFTGDEIIGKISKDFWHPDDFKKNKEKILELLEHPGSSIQIEIRSLDKNNSYHWCEAKISNQLHNPCINGFVSNYSVITERKAAEEKIKASEKLYYSLFDKSPLPIFVVEKKRLQFIEVNDTAIEMYGYSREELLKMTVFDLRVKEDQESLKEVLMKGDTDDYQNYNVRHIKKNGEKIIVDVTIEKIRYKDEVAYLGVVKDITKTVELQNQLNEEKVGKQKEITRATIDGQEKERAELGRELHDNVNQILASAKLYLSCARSADINKKNELVDESMGLIDSGIHEIRKLSKSLVPPALNKSTLKESIEELVDPVRITTDKRIDTNFSLPDESILCDRLKITIYRMIQEQMNNILKYADASRIHIVLKQDKYKLLLQVKDNGKGFDVKAKRKGIGLTNIANRAEVYNGKVVIDSAPGNGCTLSVFFPLEQLEKLRDGVITMTTPGMTA